MSILSKDVGGRVRDVLLARSLIEEFGVFGWRTVDELIERVYGAVSKLGKDWTRRRVRSIWNREHMSIRFHEMCELRDAVELAKQAEDKRALSRAAHVAFVQKAVTFNTLKD